MIWGVGEGEKELALSSSDFLFVHETVNRLKLIKLKDAANILFRSYNTC